jgi:hypothetical protein
MGEGPTVLDPREGVTPEGTIRTGSDRRGIAPATTRSSALPSMPWRSTMP